DGPPRSGGRRVPGSRVAGGTAETPDVPRRDAHHARTPPDAAATPIGNDESPRRRMHAAVERQPHRAPAQAPAMAVGVAIGQARE
ncbi:MAG: hypothetical protein QF786_02615, partial [Vicinamibacterales bacterium]|nr:hypothetical protein [Vicinamibacterales bacterium]